MTSTLQSNRYLITGVVRNAQNETTHCQVNGSLYSVEDIVNWIKTGTYEFYTTDQTGTKIVPVKVVRNDAKKIEYLRASATDKKEDNLDYLPLATL